jgi:hypothetical protein
VASLDRIVNVVISLQTTAIQQQSFSDMLVFGPSASFLTRTAIVTSVGDMVDMGIQPTDPMYLAVQDAFSQTPSVRQVFLGRKTVDFAIVSFGTVAVGNVFSIKLGWLDTNGVAQTATATFTAAAPTVASVITGLIASIASVAPLFVGTAVGSTLKVAPTVSGAPFTIVVTGPGTSVALTPLAGETIATALAAIKAENNTWYGLVSTSRVPADILAVAAWVEANEKLYVTAINEAGALDPANTTHTGYLLMNGNYFRTAWFYHADAATDYLGAAIMSKKFTQYPGSETWANARLGGVTTDLLTEGAAQAVFSRNGNTFEQFRNVSVTQSGKVAGGEWIDVIRFRDWLVEEIKIEIFSLFIDNRVPYTDLGIRQIKNKLQGALDLGVRRGGIAPEELDDAGKIVRSYVITAPLNANIPFNDKATRVLNDMDFVARLAGAIHAVNLHGTLTYANI